MANTVRPARIGGFDHRLFMPRSQPVILCRADFFHLKELYKPLDEQLAVLLGLNQGFRSGEQRNARYADFRDVEQGIVYVNDTKDHQYYPLPVDWEVAMTFLKLRQVSNCTSGYILSTQKTRRSRQGRPPGKKWWWEKTREYAKAAQVMNWDTWTPTHYRAFFAKEWVRMRYERREDPNYPLLSKVMRHRDVTFTWIYLTKFVYLEDLQKEVARFRLPQIQPDDPPVGFDPAAAERPAYSGGPV